jgi:hypothetical protein
MMVFTAYCIGAKHYATFRYFLFGKINMLKIAFLMKRYFRYKSCASREKTTNANAWTFVVQYSVFPIHIETVRRNSRKYVFCAEFDPVLHLVSSI